MSLFQQTLEFAADEQSRNKLCQLLEEISPDKVK
jgi:hypothetical protein